MSKKADADFNQNVYSETPPNLALLSYHDKENDRDALTHGADPNVFAHIRVTPLQRAVENDLPTMWNSGLANGADPDAINLWGSSSVHRVVMRRQTRIRELLLVKRASFAHFDFTKITYMCIL